MKKRTIYNLILILLLITYIVIDKIIILPKFLKYSEFITAAFFMILAFISIKLLGIRKDINNKKKESITYTIICIIIVYLLVSHLLGLVFGFLKNAYSQELTNLLGNIFAPTLIIIFMELTRYVIINANKDKKYIIVITTILLTIIELMSSIMGYDLLTFEGIFKFSALSVLPIATKNYFLSYLSYNSGIKHQILYRLPTDLLLYLLPLFPNLGETLTCIRDTLLPLITYVLTFNIINQRAYVENDFKVKKYGVADIVLLSIFLVVFCITSGIFGIEIRAIASDSMYPVIKRGDDVVFKTIDKDDIIEEQDIVGYYSGNKLIFHRVIGINQKDGVTYYLTKGDNNNVDDGKNLTIKDIKGKVLFKLPYIGYPNVLIDEYRRK